ncbi:hypothetical protein DPMN_121472 [Dreissena polymorpha]|uniref:Uncharacterized protein n=1 Tax=Dreissena polymorpha TaxID=45954 RepID=A0A9D4GM53_DREPO|nr:hypothetical protein DPMN_121472 [Dreissena polymorpha]
MSVITAAEGHGLASMAEGIMTRYREAGMDIPPIVYVDRDCCGTSSVRNLFHCWQGINIRLDIWHFMRRISVGCSTDSHPMYGLFMNHLSRCIFMWDSGDLELLKTAKRQELGQKLMYPQTDADLEKFISKNELALH